MSGFDLDMLEQRALIGEDGGFNILVSREVVLELIRRLREAERDATLLNGLRELMGYIEAGEGDTVKLFQDDATKSFFVKVGNKSYFADSFKSAIGEAVQGYLK
jgi:hypothetical protein